MTEHAKGPFDVKIAPVPLDGPAEDATLGRMRIEKQYHGALEGTGKGQMLTVGTAVKDSGVYVAIERVQGTLDGHAGAFALSHRGTMTRGATHLEIAIVPDSGTGALAGIEGVLHIEIADGKHFYDLEYTLPSNL
jgi:hypothetical protein